VFDVVKSNPVCDKAGRIPTLDLNFAKSKSLYDGRSTKNLIDHVRNTVPNSSTYVDAAGLIKRSVTNLLHYSEEFDNSFYTKVRCSVTPNATLAPNNTFTADAIVEDTSSNSHILQADGITTAVSGTTYTYSWHLKAGERTALRIVFGTDNSVWQGEAVNIDLSNGTLSNVSGFATTPVVQNAGNGWYRLSATVTAQASANGVLRMMPLVGGSVNYTGDGTSKYFIWGAQLEEASTVGEYVKTTATKSSAPRFDHDPATGESLGLLVEESRQNIMTYSAVTTSNWTNGGATVTDLSLNALGVFPGVRVASQGQVFQGVNSPAVTLTDGTTYTVTFWFRAGDVNPSNMIRLLLRNDTDGLLSQIRKTSTSTNYEDVSAYTITEGSTGAPTNVTILSVEKLSDGLTYKMSVSFDAVGVDKSHYFGMHTNSAVSGESIITLGLQLEEGSFPTSYIPTEGAAVTRGADVASITGTNFSSFYNATASSVFVHHSSDYPVPSGEFPNTFSLSDGTNNNRLMTGFLTENLGSTVVSASGSTTFNAFATADSGNFTGVRVRKAANRFEEDNMYGIVNGQTGGAVSTDDAAMPTGINVAYIGGNATNAGLKFHHIRQITYWGARLSNDRLVSLSS
jgi:hypothetical protein